MRFKFGDGVTVQQRIECNQSGVRDNPVYHMEPGMVGVVRNSYEHRGEEGSFYFIALPGPAYHIGTLHHTDWHLEVHESNLVKVWDADNPSPSISSLVVPNADYRNAAALLWQREYKKSICPKIPANVNTLYDKRGRAYSAHEICVSAMRHVAAMPETISLEDRFYIAFRVTTARLSPVNPKKEPTQRQTTRNRHVFINVYVEDRHYGGREEGGWWYDAETPIESHKVSKPAAPALLKRLKREWEGQNEGRRPISSVLSEGLYRVRMETFYGMNKHPYRPHYE